MAADGFDYRAARERVFAYRLAPTLKVLMLALIEHMPTCRPSVLRLAEMCCVERKTVLRGLAQLEREGFIEVEREAGVRSTYRLVPIPPEGTGTKLGPVPTKDGTGPICDPHQSHLMGRDRSQALGPEADPDLSRVKRDRARDGTGTNLGPVPVSPGVARTYTLPCEEPPKDYLDQAQLEFTPLERAKATWKYYWGAGLPANGVERLHPWLLQQAREKAFRDSKAPSSRGAPPAPVVDWKPKEAHERYCTKFGLDLAAASADFVGKGQLERYPAKELDEVFGRWLTNLARAKAKEGTAA